MPATRSGGPNQGSSLYVGNLDPRVSTELLRAIFSLSGKVTLCRVVADKSTGGTMGFGFVDYEERATAMRALERFSGRTVYGKTLTVDWAHAGAGAAGGAKERNVEDISNHFCLFIGNLSGEVDDEGLKEAFSKFGSCSSAKVSRDSSGGRTQGYGFVSFRERRDAEAAIEGLNGQLLANRPLRVDWAKTKTNAATRAAALGLPEPASASGRPLGSGGTNGEESGKDAGADRAKKLKTDYNTILAQTVPTNVTAYIAGLPADIDEGTIRKAMEMYGAIHEIRIPDSVKNTNHDKIYAFVRYREHDSAARAIYECQDGKEIADRPVTVQWGRESSRRMMSSRMHHMGPGYMHGYPPPGAPYMGGGSSRLMMPLHSSYHHPPQNPYMPGYHSSNQPGKPPPVQGGQQPQMHGQPPAGSYGNPSHNRRYM